ncbi:MAG: glycosyltransferase family 4 protein [Kiritimatiellae bacterium]|nr:glycosyltransferase family 4 protein [Kiritimatiellia bacterium]
MKILYISDRRDGGILRHVRCLRECLSPEVETLEIGKGGDEEFAGKSGHDIKEIWQIRRVIKTFKPDIVHFHIPALMMAMYVRLFTRLPVIRSWHTPTTGEEGLKDKVMRWLMGRGCYYLPVSSKTWEGLMRWDSGIKGEVFYNPVRIGNHVEHVEPVEKVAFTLGTVGRCDPAKGWSDLVTIAKITGLHCLGVGVTEDEAISKFGDSAKAIEWKGPQPNGREWIGKMDVFVLTSKHEEMPTVVLECFAEKTLICGFIPEGGMSEILSFSAGPLKEVFIKERDTTRLSEIVISLSNDESKRKAIVEDGWQILVNHFDAEKNCRGQLMDVYRRLLTTNH